MEVVATGVKAAAVEGGSERDKQGNCRGGDCSLSVEMEWLLLVLRSTGTILCAT